jgi:hypothetical protein
MNLPQAFFEAEAQKLLFDSQDIVNKVSSVGKTHLFFFARADATPPWEQNEQQFRFKFLAFYDEKRDQLQIEAVSVTLVDISLKRSRSLVEKNYWSSNGVLPTKGHMINEVLLLKVAQQASLETVRSRFGMVGAGDEPVKNGQTPKKGRSVRG